MILSGAYNTWQQVFLILMKKLFKFRKQIKFDNDPRFTIKKYTRFNIYDYLIF